VSAWVRSRNEEPELADRDAMETPASRSGSLGLAPLLGIAVSVLLFATAPAAATGEAAGRGVQVPVLDWQPCGPDFPGTECATAEVPLDYDSPTGTTTQIALARIPASDAADRVGSVFVNPGGPGGSGVRSY
jgi:hypothetical protein